MKERIFVFLNKIITEPDNRTPCVVRVLSIVGVVQYLVISAMHYVQHAAFDTQGFAIGFAAIIGGVGAALGMKKDSPAGGQ